jgi:DNA-binding transcriptional regulator GbsR (MarR family)
MNLSAPSQTTTAADLPDPSEFKQRHYIEDVSVLFEMVGLPRMAGRIFGWLLISDPVYQSHGELAKVLQASKGSISTMTRLLMQIGLIERFSLPGQRRDYFRIKPNSWSEIMRLRIAQNSAFLAIAERGLELLHDQPEHLRSRLEEMYDMHAFCKRELPAMLERWEQERRQKHRNQTPS